MEKDLGPKRREMSRAEFLARCRAYAQKWIDAQRLGFQRLGVLGAWDEPVRDHGAQVRGRPWCASWASCSKAGR